jgi:hypothetical protein
MRGPEGLTSKAPPQKVIDAGTNFASRFSPLANAGTNLKSGKVFFLKQKIFGIFSIVVGYNRCER